MANDASVSSTRTAKLYRIGRAEAVGYAGEVLIYNDASAVKDLYGKLRSMSGSVPTERVGNHRKPTWARKASRKTKVRA
jgi:hypothetical protein